MTWLVTAYTATVAIVLYVLTRHVLPELGDDGDDPHGVLAAAGLLLMALGWPLWLPVVAWRTWRAFRDL